MLHSAHPTPELKRILISSAVFYRAHSRQSLHITMGAPFRQNCRFPWGDLDLHLIHDSLGPFKPATNRASRLVEPFLQGPLLWQTDHATQSVTIGCTYVRSTAMRPKNIAQKLGKLGYLAILCTDIVRIVWLNYSQLKKKNTQHLFNINC